MTPLRTAPLYDTAPRGPWIAFPRPSFGVPRWPTWSMGVGERYELRPLTDERAMQLSPGDGLVMLTVYGIRGVVVERWRDAGGVPVVALVGGLVSAPCDLYDVVKAP